MLHHVFLKHHCFEGACEHHFSQSTVPVIPDSLQLEAILHVHMGPENAHYAVDKTVMQLQRLCYIPNMQFPIASM